MSTITATTAPVHPVGELRLTRRGRLVVFVAALLIALALGLVAAAHSAATHRPGPEVATETVTVAPGATLWGIAGDVAEEGEDVREVMLDIERLNALDTPVLEAGQRLRVPA